MPRKSRVRQREIAKAHYRREIVRAKNVAKEGLHRLVLVLDNMKASYNVAKIYRTAEAFSLREIHLINIPYFPPSPAMGCVRKVKSYVYDDFSNSYNQLIEQNYKLFMLDPSAELFLDEVDFPRDSALIIGHEEYGHSFDPGDFEKITPIRIRQYGQVQSLNASIAASIAAYQYLGQHRI